MSQCKKCQGLDLIKNAAFERNQKILVLREKYQKTIFTYKEYKKAYRAICDFFVQEQYKFEEIYNIEYNGRCCAPEVTNG